MLNWFDRYKRALPWRDVGDPYLVWISEIMLQQTRVDQAKPYFEHFVKCFPTVEALASADQQEVLKAWEGLGYYSRARNMHEASKTIIEKYDGRLPRSWDKIIELKGVGPYTAAAVLSIAFQKPHAVVDGNVIRVMARYLGIEKDVRKSGVRNTIQEEVDRLIDRDRPGDFNQALMELGATVCTPANPDCEKCPLQEGCVALRTMKTDQLPYKSPAKKVPHHDIAVGIVVNEHQEVLIAQRPEDTMLGGLWEFPGGKQENGESIPQTIRRELKEELGIAVEVGRPFMSLDHAYSHFKITLHAYLCRLSEGTPTPRESQQVRWVAIDELEKYPFPKANRRLTRQLISTDNLKPATTDE
ncbi:MAG: A/G-specific adenine glycosylase [Balneolaceae bacterium]|nr:A/G-specific adenine glycosylase [Balneolaceae bacterium]